MIADQKLESQDVTIGEMVALISKRFPGVSHSSLRFLEREGLILPDRSSGGHRLYHQNDAQRVLLIKTWQQEGLSLDVVKQRLIGLDTIPATDALSASFLNFVMSGDLSEAVSLILQADEIGLAPASLFGEVIAPALNQVGVLWSTGLLPIAQEKALSELVRDLIAEIGIRHAPRQPKGPVAVAACVEHERHELGLRMICGLLRMDGWRVFYLGADVAPAYVLEAAALRNPAFLLLSSRMAVSRESVKRTIEQLRRSEMLHRESCIVVGGENALHQHDDIMSCGAIPIPSSNLAEILTWTRQLSTTQDKPQSQLAPSLIRK